jgi:hypothetical protein
MKYSALFPSEKGVPFSVRRKSGRRQLVSLPPAGRTFEAAVEVLSEWATVRPAVRGDNNDLGNYNNRPNRFGMTLGGFRVSVASMRTYNHLFEKVCDYENLYDAYLGASSGKTKKEYVIEFEKNLDNNLYALQCELLTHAYKPRPQRKAIE